MEVVYDFFIAGTFEWFYGCDRILIFISIVYLGFQQKYFLLINDDAFSIKILKSKELVSPKFFKKIPCAFSPIWTAVPSLFIEEYLLTVVIIHLVTAYRMPTAYLNHMDTLDECRVDN